MAAYTCAIIAAAFVAVVYGYEQPTLARRYGAKYEAYRRCPGRGRGSGGRKRGGDLVHER